MLALKPDGVKPASVRPVWPAVIPCATGTFVVTVISPAMGELLTQVVEPAPPVACCAPTPGIDAGAIVGAALQPKPGSVVSTVPL